MSLYRFGDWYSKGRKTYRESTIAMLCVVVDLPAKVAILNCMQYNGEYGCSSCKHPGCLVSQSYQSHGCRRLNHRDGVWGQLTSFDASITGDELDSAVKLPNIRSLMAWHRRRMHDAIYSARLALFIHGIMSAKRMRKVWTVVLVRESSTQLLIYLLDKCVRYSTYLPIFKSQKGSMEALHFQVITS